MPLLVIGTPNDKVQLKLQLLDLNLCQLELLQTRSLTSGMHTSTLPRKSSLASYHIVREAIAAGYLQFNSKDGKSNPADGLRKHYLATLETSTLLEKRYK